jgi:hypothetical protein
MDSGIGDNNVETPDRVLGFAEHSPYLRGFRNVGSNRYGLATLLENPIYRGLCRLLIPSIVDDHCRSIGGQTFGDGAANPARTSRYQCRFPSKWKRHKFSF